MPYYGATSVTSIEHYLTIWSDGSRHMQRYNVVTFASPDIKVMKNTMIRTNRE